MGHKIKIRMHDLARDWSEPVHPAPELGPLGKITFASRLLGAIAGWVLFVYWWSIVLKPPMASRGHIELTVTEVVVVIVLVIGAAFYWIRHNLGIARLGHRGEVSRYTCPVFERDYFGRTLTLPPRSVLIHSLVINIRTETDKKIYRVGILRVEPAVEQHTQFIEVEPGR